jgi:phosphate:Na+ symporter
MEDESQKKTDKETAKIEKRINSIYGQAQKEIEVFGADMRKMFGMVKELYHIQEEQPFEKLFERIKKAEDASDKMENEIGRYLGQVGDAHLSDDTKDKIRRMMRQIGELESIGDSCFNLARILRRKRENKITFIQSQEDGMQQMFALVDEALEHMNDLLSGHKSNFDMSLSEDTEARINACRNTIKQQNIANLDNRVYGYDNGTVFNDIASECEKTGDYIINVVEARMGAARNGIRFKGIQLDTDGKQVKIDGEVVAFTKTEYELLKLFLENPGKVFSRYQLLKEVWPDDVIVTAHTVVVNIARIRKKLGPYADSLATRAGFGYSFTE